ncbi:MAG: YbdD/YjiX family protein [Propionibacteriaceae bacterium]|jgi:uncharacterized short protein YbdD (DUF466 family)|nr:YbdD/YjiX family protein [Propionibacteriaceae bacterium]
MLSAIAKAWRAVVWYVKALLGESDYEMYVEHLKANHPEAPLPTVSEYWRERYARESREPASRCC